MCLFGACVSTQRQIEIYIPKTERNTERKCGKYNFLHLMNVDFGLYCFKICEHEENKKADFFYTLPVAFVPVCTAEKCGRCAIKYGSLFFI